jgi:hypothetical protein
LVRIGSELLQTRPDRIFKAVLAGEDDGITRLRTGSSIGKRLAGRWDNWVRRTNSSSESSEPDKAMASPIQGASNQRQLQ